MHISIPSSLWNHGQQNTKTGKPSSHSIVTSNESIQADMNSLVSYETCMYILHPREKECIYNCSMCILVALGEYIRSLVN